MYSESRNFRAPGQHSSRESRPSTPHADYGRGSPIVTSPILSCHYCNGEFTSKNSLATHLTYQCVKKQFVLSHGNCRDCGDHFNQYDEFLRHISRSGHVNQNKKKERQPATFHSLSEEHLRPSVPSLQLQQPLPVRGSTGNSISPMISPRSIQTPSPALFKPIQSQQMSAHSGSLYGSSTPISFPGAMSGDCSPAPFYDSSQQQHLGGRPRHLHQLPRPQAHMAPTVGSLYFAGEVKPESAVAGAAWMILDAHDGLIVQGSIPVTPPQPQITPSQIRAEYEALYQGLVTALQHRISILVVKGTSELIHAHFFNGPKFPLFAALCRSVEDLASRISQLILLFQKVSYEHMPSGHAGFTQKIAGDAIHLFESRRAEMISPISLNATVSDVSMAVGYPTLGQSSSGFHSSPRYYECSSPTSRESASVSASRATSSSNTPPRQFSPRNNNVAVDSLDAKSISYLSAGLAEWFSRSEMIGSNPAVTR